MLTPDRHRPLHDKKSPNPLKEFPVKIMSNKIVAGALAGLALTGGTLAFAVGSSGTASAATTAQSALTQDVAPTGVRGWLRQHRQEIRQEIAQTAADKIGISVDELKADYKDGQSISEIATAHGVDPQTVADALVAKATDTLNQAVADGKLTQERADKAEARLPDLATRVIDHHKGDHQAKPAS
ncbi:MAG: hypothetical protein ACXWB2_06945 [Acidimicrobiales bacterium]